MLFGSCCPVCLNERQLWSLNYVFPRSIHWDPLDRCSSETPRLCLSLEAIFFALERKTVLRTFRNVLLSAHTKPNAAAVLLLLLLLPELHREAACAQRPRWRTPRFRTCSRADSARAPNPLEPYPPRAGHLHVTHSESSQSRPQRCVHVTANPSHSRAGEDGDWLMRIPWANDAQRDCQSTNGVARWSDAGELGE